jgi:hypothetical protein
LEDVTETPEGQTEPVTTKGLKSQWIDQIKNITNSLLVNTDWMVIRKAERNIAIPSEVSTKRAAILSECDRLISAITAASSIEEFITVVSSANWN